MWSFSRRLLSVFLASSLFASQANSASLAFVEQTRLIFNATSNAVAFPLKNDSSLNYLVKCIVKNADSNGKPTTVNSDFAILPEVFVLSPQSRKTLQVARLSGQYPHDRESVFYLNGFFVPEVQGQTENSFNLAVSVNVKVFYRPKGLVKLEAVKDVSETLQFEYESGSLKVSNPSPYFVTFGTLRVDEQSFGVEQLQKMVPPFGSQSYSIAVKNLKQVSVEWSLIDEFGNKTDQLSRSVRGR